MTSKTVRKRPDEASAVKKNESPVPQTTAPTSAPAMRKCMVIFSFVRQDGTTGTQRVFLNGVPDLRTERDIQAAEKMILEASQSSSVPYAVVMIRDWRALEG